MFIIEAWHLTFLTLNTDNLESDIREKLVLFEDKILRVMEMILVFCNLSVDLFH